MKNTLTIALIFSSVVVFGQGLGSKAVHNKNNTAYLELLGNAFLYSLNYERTLIKNNKYSFSGRIGISYYTIGFQAYGFGMFTRYRSFPLTFNISRHFNRHNIEIGAGTVNEFSNGLREEIGFNMIPTLHAGYRRYTKNNMDFRAGITLSKADLDSDPNFEVFLWPYISIGKRF